ncbi:MaoC/PaaZ C-terminal domain-containing protein [Lederbergia citrea]|uniref:MaoC family dehydratase N-terminal domain-containing protein n=1 Tax=Lederbergia citrea TaxID=2833581 RepID=A0A942Z4S4_9BACI|nr:MaoC/PaaZ C-terminal domain-containing protein [Lederbergia citrea]MBS4176067.1 MaoC family dehydratase N-terminal domain-containing protein [Lederbergia citrea]MBS4202628.1 MaoC family dehydratase N-terminal domain-containing protein [Lederbergia citrea]MBS4222705.1 MaoC family dehydratase N-terminal domain-containing protein [Lederbergia citrea]
MLLGKKRKLGRTMEEITRGEKLTLTEKIEDKDLLLFLGLTNDANPLYIQHDYASQTTYKKPIVPTIMLTGIITSAVSKYLPGPGSHILKQEIEFLQPVYHYATIQFLFEITDVNEKNHTITVNVQATDEQENMVIKGKLLVCPPFNMEPMTGEALENF